jgi:hypothetical protein
MKTTPGWPASNRNTGRLRVGTGGRLQAGEVAILIRQLKRKFGPVSDGVRQTLAGADQEQLEKWGLALIDARSIEEVFR